MEISEMFFLLFVCFLAHGANCQKLLGTIKNLNTKTIRDFIKRKMRIKIFFFFFLTFNLKRIYETKGPLPYFVGPNS